MATLTVSTLSRAGVDMAGVTPAAGGDEWPNTGRELLEVKNGSGSPITVTLDIKPLVDGDLTVTDPTVSVAAGATKMIGPFPPGIYNDTTTNRAKATCSATASVTVRVVKFVPE